MSQITKLLLVILSHPAWQSIGALLGILVAFYIYSLQRTKKSLSYEILSEVALLSDNEALKGELELLFQGRPIKNGYLVTLKIMNDGKEPITPNDFTDDFLITFSDIATIFSAEIIERNPKHLKAKINAGNANSIVLSPTLLNSNDCLIIKFLIGSHTKGSIELFSRITGVHDITLVSPTRPKNEIIILAAIILMGILVALFNNIMLSSLNYREFILITMLLAVVGYNLKQKYLNFPRRTATQTGTKNSANIIRFGQ